MEHIRRRFPNNLQNRLDYFVHKEKRARLKPPLIQFILRIRLMGLLVKYSQGKRAVHIGKRRDGNGFVYQRSLTINLF